MHNKSAIGVVFVHANQYLTLITQMNMPKQKGVRTDINAESSS